MRAAVLATGVIAAVVSITIGITGLSSRRIEPRPDGSSEGLGASPVTPGQGASAKVLTPKEIGNGFALVQSGPQGVQDLVARLPPSIAGVESERLNSLGFRDGAVTIAYKPPIAPGPLTDTAVTVQILGFETAEGALGQLRYDAQGGLAAGFQISDPYQLRNDYRPSGVQDLQQPGILIRKSPPQGQSSAAQGDGNGTTRGHVLVAAVVRDTWEIVVEVRSAVPPSIEEIDRLVTLQASKLGL